MILEWPRTSAGLLENGRAKLFLYFISFKFYLLFVDLLNFVKFVSHNATMQNCGRECDGIFCFCLVEGNVLLFFVGVILSHNL